MGFAVEVYFDPQTEMRIRQLWQGLADQGINSILPAIGSRPHLSLAVYDRVEPAAVEAELAAVARDQAPLALALASAGAFPGAECVVFLAPVVTPDLLRLHRRVDARLSGLGLRAHDYYRPGRWVPHCTLAMELEPEQVPHALDVCRSSGVFGAATVVEIGLVEFRPVREICTFALSLAGGPGQST